MSVSYTHLDVYKRQEMSNGVRDTVSYSYYANQAFSPPSGGKQGTISFNISNNLEMKYKDKNDSIRKVSLIDDLSMGISYNTAAEVRPWSDLTFNLRMKLSKSYTLSMASTFATYAYEFDSSGNVVTGNRTEWSYGRFGRWSGYGTSFSWTVNNDSWKKIRGFFTGEKEEDKDKDKNKDASSEEDSDCLLYTSRCV